jgi:hypothetical protein
MTPVEHNKQLELIPAGIVIGAAGAVGLAAGLIPVVSKLIINDRER